MKKTILAAAVFAAVVADCIAAATVGPEWCVAYPESGSKEVNRVLKIAAEEVRDDIKEATGLRLMAVPESKAKSPAIYIGAEFAKKAGFDLSDLKWYDNVIAEKDGSIYLFGNDLPGRDPAKFGRFDWFRCVIPSVKAATRFLETAAGVRFLMPGEVGKEVPKRKEVSVSGGCFSVERPSHVFGSGRSNQNRSLIYLVANGVWGMGLFHSYGGHTYPVACPGDKYFATHPEYFGMKNGKRMLGPTRGQTPLCISNPDVEELIVEELRSKFDAGADVCQLAQNDGWKFCECAKCRAMFGTGDDWGEKLWIFHRKIAERLLKERPGKIVHILSYDMTRHPPKTFKVFPKNVMIEMCHYSEEDFREWRRCTVPHGFTVYTYLSGDYVQPGFVARHSFAYLAQLVRRFRDNSVKGIFRCGTGGGVGDLYGTEGPGYYVFNKLLLDGSLNVNALLADYCSAAFGPAAEQMRKFYDTMDARLRMCDRIVFESFDSDAAAGLDGYVIARPKNPLDLHGWMFSPDTVMQMEESLSRAERTGGLSAKQKKRLELVRLEFDYAKNLGAISTLYSAYKLRPTKESLSVLVEEIGNRNAYLDKVFAGGEKPKSLDGWPEIMPFGATCTRKLMNVNGRLLAPIGAPLTWSARMLKGALPGAEVKSADAVKVSAPPTFGDFNGKSGWNILGGMGMERVRTKSRFKTLYDGANLYVLIEGDLSDDFKVRSFPHDGPCWDDDCVDVMLAPGSNKDVHYHLIWNVDPSSRYDDVTGLIKSPLDPGYGKADVTWNGKGWKTESRRENGKWLTIATIPYSDLGVSAPKSGDSWFINVGREARAGKDSKDFEYLLWSPNMESRSFVAPNAMGRLIFK